MFFKRKTLSSILSSFEKVATDLEQHISTKISHNTELLEIRNAVDSEIKEISAEVDKARKVLSKVVEFVV